MKPEVHLGTKGENQEQPLNMSEAILLDTTLG
jgi:hypothetical protein